jgi:hypothetical protein
MFSQHLKVGARACCNASIVISKQGYSNFLHVLTLKKPEFLVYCTVFVTQYHNLGISILYK